MSKKIKRTPPGDQPQTAVARHARRHEVPAKYGRKETVLFAATLFLSAALLFTVEPMFAKMVLPRLGGAPAVWNACLVFYQAVLLGGYLYAHLSLKWLGARRQAVLHLALLALAWVSLPIHIADYWLPPVTTFPAPWLWMLLAVSLGLPLWAISASAPMLQAWFARIGGDGKGKTRQPPADRPRRDPYFLYAASNLGSLLGLAAYPLLMESRLTLAGQSLAWAAGFGLLTALVAACAVMLWRRPEGEIESPSTAVHKLPPPAMSPRDETTILWRRRLRWLALALAPSSLMMGVTTYITSEITQLPALWIIPLALYLLTFVIVFAPRSFLSLKWMLRVQAPLIVLAAMSLMFNVAGLREMLLLGTLHLLAFFVTALVCHGQLAADRPEPEKLTEFYLWMSLGGVLGGLFSALLAPLVFKQALEYPLMMAAACMLRPQGSTQPGALRARRDAGYFDRRDLLPAIALLVCLAAAWGLRNDSFLSGKYFSDGLVIRLSVLALAAAAALLLMRRPIVFGAAIAALAAVGLWSTQTGVRLLDRQRSFFGILRVEYDMLWNTHQLFNGTTTHGVQSLYEDERREPQGYYHRTGPLGEIFATLRPRRPLGEVGVLGLGAGAVAAYAEPGERFTFYEIDPAVERIARNPAYFTYLADCRGKTDVVLGDARLSLKNGPQRQFDLLILDVFSSDSVPVHLMTREAMQLYCGRLRPHGVLAFHISSRYFQLEPVLGRLAADAGLTARIWRDHGGQGREIAIGWCASVWVAMALDPADLGNLMQFAHWEAPVLRSGPVWTDNFSDLVSAMRWQPTDLQLVPMRWRESSKARRAAAHAEIATAYLRERRFDDALDQFQRSVALEPNNAPSQYALGRLLASQERWQEAVDHYADALIREPVHAAWLCDCGVALAKLHQDDDAIERFHDTLKVDPGYVEAYDNLANLLLARGQVPEALKAFRQGIAARPDNALIRYHLGWAELQMGDAARALPDLRAALPLAKQQKDAPLIDKLETEIRRCEKRMREGK